MLLNDVVEVRGDSSVLEHRDRLLFLDILYIYFLLIGDGIRVDKLSRLLRAGLFFAAVLLKLILISPVDVQRLNIIRRLFLLFFIFVPLSIDDFHVPVDLKLHD